MNNASISYAELRDFANSLGENGAGIGATSTILSQIEEFKGVAANSALSESQKYQFVAEQFYSKYTSYAQTASEFAERAESSGNARGCSHLLICVYILIFGRRSGCFGWC